jgi:hypothetical protein
MDRGNNARIRYNIYTVQLIRVPFVLQSYVRRPLRKQRCGVFFF